ncbi:MAG: PepSY domain-containing protein [Methanobacterium sp.]
MKNKSFVSIIAIIILIVGVSGCVDNTQSVTNASNPTLDNASTTTNASTVNVKITPEEAKNIAQKYINQSGATAGEPVLKTDGNKVYIVPIIINGNPAGEIIIDAQTGENQGSTG